MSTYTGMWRRSTAYTADDGTQVAVITPDPAHAVRDQAADPRSPIDAPTGALVAGDGDTIVTDLGSYPGADWWGSQTYSTSVDGTDTRTHDDQMSDAGAARESFRAEPDMQFSDESYTMTAPPPVAEAGVQLVNPVFLSRGRNGTPSNDPRVSPDVVPDAWYVTARRMLLRNLRQHERRVVQLDTADTLPTRGPAVAGSHGSPVPWGVRSVDRRPATPTIRRIPEPLSQSITRDDSDVYGGGQGSPVADVWVM